MLQQAINDAYLQQIGQIYAVLSRAFEQAGDNEAEMAAALQRFKNGVALAERTRDAAIAALGLSDN